MGSRGMPPLNLSLKTRCVVSFMCPSFTSREKKHLAPTKQDGWDPEPARRFLRKQKSLPLLVIEPRFLILPSHSLVNTLNELNQLPAGTQWKLKLNCNVYTTIAMHLYSDTLQYAHQYLTLFFFLALHPPLGVVFCSPLAGFSLLAYEVSWSHKTMRHSR